MDLLDYGDDSRACQSEPGFQQRRPHSMQKTPCKLRTVIFPKCGPPEPYNPQAVSNEPKDSREGCKLQAKPSGVSEVEGPKSQTLQPVARSTPAPGASPWRHGSGFARGQGWDELVCERRI